MVASLLTACAGEGSFVATPQRPSYSSDTGTTAEGTLEVEGGLSLDPDNYFDVPLTLKWGAGPRAELYLGWSPYRRLQLPAQDVSGVGDLALGTRYRFLEAEQNRPSAAVQFAVKVPTADDARGLGSGETDFNAAGILTHTLRNTTLVGFYQPGILGRPGGLDSDVEHGLAAVIARPVAENVSGFVEFAAVLNPDSDSKALSMMLGVGRQLDNGVVLDAAVAIGLNDDASGLVIQIGATTNLGNPFARGSAGE